MPASSYGIIVEGTYDSAVYEAIIRRLASHDVSVRAFDCRGKPNLMQRFPAYLEALRYGAEGKPLVDMAIVIVDADMQDPTQLEATMRARVEKREYPFTLHFHAVRHAMEAWLLADANAISAVTQRRSGRPVTKSHDAPEELANPKATFRALLTDSKVDYTPAVGAEIANGINVEVLGALCPRFRRFVDLVDC